MDIKKELIKYAKWFDKVTMPEDAQTDEADLAKTVEDYLQDNGKDLVQACSNARMHSFWEDLISPLPEVQRLWLRLPMTILVTLFCWAVCVVVGMIGGAWTATEATYNDFFLKCWCGKN